MVCMPVNKKGMYCVVNVVIVSIGEFDRRSWLSRPCETEVGVNKTRCLCKYAPLQVREKTAANIYGEKLNAREGEFKNKQTKNKDK